MTALICLFSGIVMQAIAHRVYDATPTEGFLAYGIGFAIGMLIAREARDSKEAVTSEA